MSSRLGFFNCHVNLIAAGEQNRVHPFYSGRRPRCVCLLAIMHKAAVSLTHVFWWPHAHISLGHIFRGGRAGPGGGCGVVLLHGCAFGGLEIY